MHNEELHNLYASPNTITVIKARRMRWAGQVVRMGEMRNACNIFVRKPEEKSPFGTPCRGCEWILRKIGWSCVEWINLAQDRDQWRAIVNMVMNFRVP